MLKNILLVDDDPLQSQAFEARLRKKYTGATVRHLDAESEFNEFVDAIRSKQSELPDLVIVDIMLPWAVANSNAPPAPKAVEDGGFSRAGVRCLQTFRKLIDHPVPWVLFTILDIEAIEQEIGDVRYPERTVILNKEQPVSDLFREIDRLSQ